MKQIKKISTIIDNFIKLKKDNEDNIVPIEKFSKFYEKEIFASQYIHKLDDILNELKDVQ